MRDLSVWNLTLRLLLAAGAGLALGFERELRARAAGLRTHALVAIGAALFTIVGAYGFADVPHGPSIDPARLAAQVASGIGFLGAGAILRHGLDVKGLTTAATLWLAAAIGVAAGAGAYAAVLIGTGIVLVILVVLRLGRPWLMRYETSTTTLEVAYDDGVQGVEELVHVIASAHGRVDHMEMVDDEQDLQRGIRRALVTVATRHPRALRAVVEALRGRNEVHSVVVSQHTPEG